MKYKSTKQVNNNGSRTTGDHYDHNAQCHLIYTQEQESYAHTKPQPQLKHVSSLAEMESYTVKEMDRPTRNNCWKGTRGHRKDKSRYYETWYKAIRIMNDKYQKQYYRKRENELFKTQLEDYFNNTSL